MTSTYTTQGSKIATPSELPPTQGPAAAVPVVDETGLPEIDKGPAHAQTLPRLQRPATTQGGKIVWRYAIPITTIHLLALTALVPWLFSWTGVILFVLGIYFYGSVGINLCYHRLLAHRSFKCKPWVERFLVLVALCCMEDAPGRWVATHRLHHKESDTQPDPHSPLVSFLWSHIGWLLIQNRGLHNVSVYERYARDILKQPFYLNLERNLVPIWIYGIHAAAYFVIAGGIAWAITGSYMAGVQMGASAFVWGVLVRTVVVWHITWSVNSLTHLFGYRTHQTDDDSRNNWLVAVLTNGEGWHNNHHASPSSASNRQRWWEFDFVYGLVLLMEKTGLAWDVVHARPSRIKRVKDTAGN